MVGYALLALAILSVFSFWDQGRRSSCSYGRKQKFKARGWRCWGEGVKGHLKLHLACTCHTHILFVKAGHMLKTTVTSWGSVLSLQRRYYKVT